MKLLGIALAGSALSGILTATGIDGGVLDFTIVAWAAGLANLAAIALAILAGCGILRVVPDRTGSVLPWLAIAAILVIVVVLSVSSSFAGHEFKNWYSHRILELAGGTHAK